MTATNKKHVLVVEDEASLNALYAQLLKGDGYDVSTSTNGKEAFELLSKEPFDIVLLDIMLPDMDGLTILKNLHDQKKKIKHGSIVLLTNLAQNDTIAQALKYNVKGYLIKSRYTPDQFLEEVKKLTK